MARAHSIYYGFTPELKYMENLETPSISLITKSPDYDNFRDAGDASKSKYMLNSGKLPLSIQIYLLNPTFTCLSGQLTRRWVPFKDE